MKKKLILIGYLILSLVIAIGQTTVIERENLVNRHKSGELDLEKYKEFAQSLAKLEPILNDLSQLPIDSSGELSYSKVLELKGLNKKSIYNRIMEFGAINFGSLNAVLQYSDFESGKIIMKGYTDLIHKVDEYFLFSGIEETLRSTKCFFTLIYTIKDNKVKINVRDILFKYDLNEKISGSYYVPAKTIEIPFKSIFPITNRDKSIEWKSNLDMLKQANVTINLMISKTNHYINNIEVDYGF
jgi:hypothetical protein